MFRQPASVPELPALPSTSLGGHQRSSGGEHSKHSRELRVRARTRSHSTAGPHTMWGGTGVQLEERRAKAFPVNNTTVHEQRPNAHHRKNAGSTKEKLNGKSFGANEIQSNGLRSGTEVSTSKRPHKKEIFEIPRKYPYASMLPEPTEPFARAPRRPTLGFGSTTTRSTFGHRNVAISGSGSDSTTVLVAQQRQSNVMSAFAERIRKLQVYQSDSLRFERNIEKKERRARART
eukprot:19504_1